VSDDGWRLDDSEARDEVFRTLCYMAVSARGCVNEPPLYGPFRLIDALSRLIDAFDRAGEADDFLLGIKKRIDESKFSVMTDADQFVGLLDDLVLTFTRELKRRRLKGGKLGEMRGTGALGPRRRPADGQRCGCEADRAYPSGATRLRSTRLRTVGTSAAAMAVSGIMYEAL